MSIRVNSGSMLLGRTSGFQSTNGVGSWSYIARLRSDLNDYGHLFAQTVDNDEINGDYQNSDFIGHGPDGTSSYASSYVSGSGAGGGSTSSLTVDTWYRFTLVRESTTTLKYYVNSTLVETITQNVSGRSAIGGEWFGRLNGGYPADVSIEGFISWSVALNSTEVGTQSSYLNPAVQTSNVTTYVPMTDSTLANALVATTGTNLSVIFGTPVTDTNSGYSVFSGGLSLNLTGASSTAQTGSLTQSRTYSTSGTAVAAQAGSVAYSTTGAVTLTLAGQAVATQLGSLTQSRTYSASGTAVAAQAGTISPRWQAPVGWTDITGEDGYRIKWGTAPDTYTASADVAADTTSYTITGLLFGTTYYTRTYGLLAGVEQEGSVERVLTQNDITLALSGASATTTAGAISYGLSRTASGQLVTVSPGAIATARTLAPTGAAATAQTGALAVNTSGGVTAALTGAEATSSAGTVSEGLSLALTGLQITATPGSVSASSSQGVTLTLSGQAATATAGSLSTARAAALSGTVATMLPGNVGMPGNANPEFDLLAAICRLAPRGTRLWRACRAAGYPVR